MWPIQIHHLNFNFDIRVEGDPEEAPPCLPNLPKSETSSSSPLHLCVTYSLGSSKVFKDCWLFKHRKTWSRVAPSATVWNKNLSVMITCSQGLPWHHECWIVWLNEATSEQQVKSGKNDKHLCLSKSKHWSWNLGMTPPHASVWQTSTSLGNRSFFWAPTAR